MGAVPVPSSGSPPMNDCVVTLRPAKSAWFRSSPVSSTASRTPRPVRGDVATPVACRPQVNSSLSVGGAATGSAVAVSAWWISSGSTDSTTSPRAAAALSASRLVRVAGYHGNPELVEDRRVGFAGHADLERLGIRNPWCGRCLTPPRCGIRARSWVARPRLGARTTTWRPVYCGPVDVGVVITVNPFVERPLWTDHSTFLNASSPVVDYSTCRRTCRRFR